MDIITQNHIILVIFAMAMMVIMVFGFYQTAPQGSISFSFKALGLHFEVKKGSLN